MKSKIIFILMISILAIFLVFSSCTIISDRWVIEWHNTKNTPATRSITIFNKTDETISSIKFFVGDKVSSDWSTVTSVSTYLGVNQSVKFDIGTGSEDISAVAGDTIWIKVAAEGWSQSQLFAVDGFVSELQDEWQAHIYKK
jgi:hypothetical protein